MPLCPLCGMASARTTSAAGSCGLMYLGTEGRRHVEGGAPYLYEARQGMPQYPPDAYDSLQTYPM